MKKALLIVSLFLAGLTAVKAQDDQPGDEAKKQEKIKALYIAYISQQLQLSPDEAQKFWPVHGQFENELRSVKHDMPELEKQQAVLNIKKKYQENFNRILGPNRCERFYRMDGEFKRKLLERIRNQRQNQVQRPKMRRGQR
ncbi:MAG: hypothetical protein IPI66_05350 [Chitinophagaceae bacterium]|nr:hypothetical protein [Chitinophagaceae bacterium]MBL0055770.1 hypothetical protein [Chitinophagaceae bacterium]